MFKFFSNTGKSLLANLINAPMRSVGLAQTSSSFAFSNLLGPCNAVLQNEILLSMALSEYKLLLGGEDVTVDKKNCNPEALTCKVKLKKYYLI